jgi:hypothetical protein
MAFDFSYNGARNFEEEVAVLGREEDQEDGSVKYLLQTCKRYASFSNNGNTGIGSHKAYKKILLALQLFHAFFLSAYGIVSTKTALVVKHCPEKCSTTIF